MAFTIPNAASAGVPAQAEVDSVDIDALVLAHQRYGVLTGCAVTAQGTPNMTVAVAAGTIAAGSAVATVSSGNVTITTADGTNPRFDLVVSSNAGVKSAVAGTPAATPVFPAIPASSVVLAAVYVPASATTITTARIIDKRAILLGFPDDTTLENNKSIYGRETGGTSRQLLKVDTSNFIEVGNTSSQLNLYSSNDAWFNGSYKMWHSNNDGSGSGLDADLLDGHDTAFFSANPHGIADHTDRTQSHFVSALSWVPIFNASGAQSSLAAAIRVGIDASLRFNGMGFSATADNYLTFEWELPLNYASGTLSFKLWFYQDTANTSKFFALSLLGGSVRTSGDLAEDVTTNAMNATEYVAVPNTQYEMKEYTCSTTWTVANTRRLLSFRIGRLGSNSTAGQDDAAGLTVMKGIEIIFTADQ